MTSTKPTTDPITWVGLRRELAIVASAIGCQLPQLPADLVSRVVSEVATEVLHEYPFDGHFSVLVQVTTLDRLRDPDRRSEPR
jgi:hypothetical protein